MILDFLEAYKTAYNFLSHLKMIQWLSRSNKAISQICPEILENKHFWRPSSNSYNSQTI